MRDIQILMQHPVDNAALTLIQGLAKKCKNIEQDVLMTANALIDVLPGCPECEDYVRNEVALVFDNCHTPNTYIDLAMMRQFAKRILKRFEKELDGQPFYRIKEILEGLADCHNENAKNELMDSLCRHLEEKDQLPGPIGEALNKLINKYGRVGFDILGDYNHGAKTITIYVQNVMKNNAYNCDTTVVSTFAHEVFHAYHFQLMKLLGNRPMFRIFFRRRREDDIVIESLASYFERHFDERHGLTNRADEIKDSWRRYSPRIYPYSGAKWITDEGHFRDVVLTSARNLDDAFKLLKYHI